MIKSIIFNALIVMYLCSPKMILAQNADEILKKHFAITGFSNLKDIKTITVWHTVTAQGMEIPIKTIAKKPNSQYTEKTMQGQKIAVGYDGQKGWMLNPTTNPSAVEIPEAQLDEIKGKSPFEQMGIFIDYKASGHKAEYLGKENIKEKPAYKIKLSKKDGDVAILFIDASSFMRVKQIDQIKMAGQVINTETVLTNFKELDGLIIPYSSAVTTSNQKESATMTLTKFEVNRNVNDSIFKMPAP